jgi:hypothetical protein
MRLPVPKSLHVERTSRVGGLLPWVAVLAIALSGSYTRLVLGHWPKVYRESPDFPLGHAAAIAAALAALSLPAVVCVALLLPIVRLGLRARPVVNRWVFSGFVGTLVLYQLVTLDPFGFLDWVFD